MMLARGMVALIAMALLAGCVVRDRTTVPGDPHRAWWEEHHRNEAYDRARADREHRDWCAHTPDRSCEGWR